jgi:serine/threonine protein kinase
MLDMQKEFNIAKDLVHSNIVQYKHFVRKKGEKDKEEEFHLIIEYMRGGNLK